MQPGPSAKCPHLVAEGERPFPFLPVIFLFVYERTALTFISQMAKR